MIGNRRKRLLWNFHSVVDPDDFTTFLEHFCLIHSYLGEWRQLDFKCGIVKHISSWFSYFWHHCPPKEYNPSGYMISTGDGPCDMNTSWHALLALCDGNPLVTRGSPSQRTNNADSYVYFDFILKYGRTNSWVAGSFRSHDAHPMVTYITLMRNKPDR